jgi:ferric-dicitrate binding protein FerR (iron transport regulator)
MENRKNIQTLLKKQSEGTLTPLEAQQLRLLLREENTDQDVKMFFEEIWEENAYNDTNIPTEQLWQKLQEKIPVETSEKQSNTYRKLIPFLKYAALIVITISITLLAQKYLKEKQIEPVAFKLEGGINEITVSYGSKSRVTLPDGSVVNLNSGSTLRYPAKFSNTSRNVYLQGEAFFDVKKDPTHPFLVKTDAITIKVLGTKFNVKSYADEKTIQTTLVSGAVEIYSNKKELSENNKLLTLVPNQQAIIEKNIENASLIENQEKKDLTVSDTLALKNQIDIVVAWKDNRLVFRDEKFDDLSKKLERWYDVEIDIRDTELRTVLFSGVFVKETIEQALDALKLATPFKYQMKKNQIIITKQQ